PSATIEDVPPEDVSEFTIADLRLTRETAGRGLHRQSSNEDLHRLGLNALAEGSVAVVTLAAGAGSRWTQGAGVVKALHPFCRLAGRHRTFIETHLAKSRRTSRQVGTPVPHIFTTGYLTH